MRKRGQSTIEYVVILGIIVAALVTMATFVKRGAQGRMKSYADQLADGSAYSPRATNSYYLIKSGAEERTDLYAIGADESGTAKQNITDTYVQGYRAIDRQEAILPFSSEPARGKQ